jgi:hypothetical protein
VPGHRRGARVGGRVEYGGRDAERVPGKGEHPSELPAAEDAEPHHESSEG